MIHHVYANRSNIGDWLSARGIQKLLGGMPAVEHLCDEPFAADTLAALHAATREDVIVIGGGGLFMDYFDPFWEGLSEVADAPALCLWGVGYCDLKDEASHPRIDVIRRVIGRSDLCVVRDDLTRRHLGVPGLGAPVACPSLCVVDPAPPGWGVLHVDNYTTVGADAYAVMDEVCRAHAQRSNRPYRQTNNRIDPVTEPQLLERLGRYEMSDIVVSSALHGCIIAVAMGLPVVAVSGDTKIEAFMQAAGLGEWVLDAREVHCLPQRLERIHHQRAVPDFVARSRHGNRTVADAVRHICCVRSRAGRAAVEP